MSIVVEKGEGISAKVITDSISSRNGKRITTFELEYPRYIHAELLTHRKFSRNAASSRAVPIQKMISLVFSNPAKPSEWGANQKGMQASKQLTGWRLKAARWSWKGGAKVAAGISKLMSKLGVHKQIANRITEPFQPFKSIVTATEFNNWFALRDHEDAQPEIRLLAGCMRSCREMSEPRVLNPGEWHLPYVSRDEDGNLLAKDSDGEQQHIDLETAKKLSMSCCAQVSFRNLNESLKIAENIYQKLVGSKPVHSSPTEHQATPMENPEQNIYEGKVMVEPGMTHIDVSCNAWSGNFKGWIQNRQLIPEHDVKG